jgi:predicted nucleic acid-binding protein
MNVYVVDSNIIFSTFLNLEGNIGDLLLNSSDVFEYYAPEYLKEEIDNHKEEIKTFAKLNTVEFEQLKQLIFSRLTFLSDQIIPFEVWYASAKLVRDVDEDDIAFVAYSQYYDKEIWTGDKKFIKGMQAKGFDRFIFTKELLELRAAIRQAI